MSILIGGSPSTGSSLLRRILNRHSQIFCGSESSLFAKEELYINWDKSKSSLFRRFFWGLSNAGWHHYRGVDLPTDYGVSHTELKGYVEKADSFKACASMFYEKVLKENNKILWAEKTPSNAFTLKYFLETFEEGHVIHIVRHPLDCIASLYNRGMDVYNAIAVYLLNTSQALELHYKKRYICITYESLVNDPKQSILDLMLFLKLEFEPNMLKADKKAIGVVKMEGWQYKETGNIGNASVGRFKKLSREERRLIMDGLSLMRSTLSTSSKNVFEIADVLDYKLQMYDRPSAENIKYYKKMMTTDKRKRFLKQSYFKSSNYPLIIDEG